MNVLKRLLLLLLFVAALAGPARADEPGPRSEAARLLARSLPRLHLSHRPFDDQVAAAALDIYLSALDYEHAYFLASDIAQFRQSVTNLDNWLAEGNVDFAYQVYDLFRSRVSNRVEYVNHLLTNTLDLTTSETYEWKRKKAPWPANEAEWDDLWRRRAKNQYVARTASQLLGETNGIATEVTEDLSLAGEIAPAPTPAPAPLTPAEFVLKSYRQYLTVLSDNDSDWVLERYLTAFAEAYDPHSDYLSVSNTEDFDIGMKLSLVGIGALLSSEDGAAKVERLIPGGPAEKDGRLKAEDKIIAVAQDNEPPVDILHWPLNKAVRLIRGKKNTRVVLTVIPASDVSGTTTKSIDLIRDEVKLEEQAAKGRVEAIADATGATQKLGVITLQEFYADLGGRREFGAEARSSVRDVRRILDDLRTQHVAGIVLDLRNNGGGLLTEAIEMAGLFMGSGPVVQVSDARGTQILNDLDPDNAYRGPLIVLVNRQTASASEIVAGALQDYHRAVIVGDSKTHGKGTVQSMVNLRGGEPQLGTLKVTTASFYRIAGGSTQLKGVIPDIITPSILDSMEVGEEYLPHAMSWSVVDRALYRPAADLEELLPALRRQSEERRANDPRFQAYKELLERLGERQRSSDVSLKLEDRVALARSEKELQKLIQDTDPKDGEKKEQPTSDLVLIESLHILSDLIALQAQPPAAPLAATKPVEMPVAE